MTLNESHVEEAALTWFEELGYAIGHGPHMAPGESASERDIFADVVLIGRLRNAITRLNPTIPIEAREDALRNVLHPDNPSFLANNRAFHHQLRDGVEVEYKRPDGSIAGDHVRLVDFTDVQANDWLAVNQFTVIEAQHNRRPDITVAMFPFGHDFHLDANWLNFWHVIQPTNFLNAFHLDANLQCPH